MVSWRGLCPEFWGFWGSRSRPAPSAGSQKSAPPGSVPSLEIPGYRENCRDSGALPPALSDRARFGGLEPARKFGLSIRVFNKLKPNFCPRANSSSGTEFPGNRAGRIRIPLLQKPRGENRDRDSIAASRSERRLPKEEEMRELTGNPWEGALGAGPSQPRGPPGPSRAPLSPRIPGNGNGNGQGHGETLPGHLG